MKILLIAPPFKKFKANVLETYPPLSVLSLSAFIKSKGYNVKVLDLTVVNQPYKKLSSALEEFKPDVIGISSIIASFNGAIKTAKCVKNVNNSIKIVLGGIYPSFNDKNILIEHQEIDFIVRGEGEMTLYELLEAIKNEGNYSKIKGLSFMENGIYTRNKDRPLLKNLTQLPIPDYGSLETMPIYQKKGKFLVISSRGCVFSCTFCSTSNYWQHQWRAREAKDVLVELEVLVKKYKAKEILIGDDLFIVDAKRVESICEGIIKKDLKFSWRCSIRANFFTYQMAKKLKAAGCESVFLGVESGDAVILKKINKHQTKSQVKKVAKICKKVGLHLVASFMMGFPWEREININRTIKLAKGINADQSIWFLFHPDIGSPIYKDLTKYGIKVIDENPDDCIRIGESHIETKYLDKRKLENLYLDAILSTD